MAKLILVVLFRLSFLFKTLGFEPESRLIDPPEGIVAGRAGAAQARSDDYNFSTRVLKDPLSLKRARPEPVSVLHPEAKPIVHPDLTVDAVDGHPHRALGTGQGAQELPMHADHSQVDGDDHQKMGYWVDPSEVLPVSHPGLSSGSMSNALSHPDEEHSTKALVVNSPIELRLPQFEDPSDDSSVQKGKQAIKCPANSTPAENDSISTTHEGQPHELTRVAQSVGALGVETHISMVKMPSTAHGENNIQAKSTSQEATTHDLLNVAQPTNEFTHLATMRRPSGSVSPEIISIESPPLEQTNPHVSGGRVKVGGKGVANMKALADVPSEIKPQVYFKPPGKGGSLIMKPQVSSKIPPGMNYIKDNPSLEQTMAQEISETNKVRGGTSDRRKAPGEVPMETQSRVLFKPTSDGGSLVIKNQSSASISPPIKATGESPRVKKRKPQESGQALYAMETQTDLPYVAKPKMCRNSQGDRGSVVKHQTPSDVLPVLKSVKENPHVGKTQPQSSVKKIKAAGEEEEKRTASANASLEPNPPVRIKPPKVGGLGEISNPPESVKPEVPLDFPFGDKNLYSWIGSLYDSTEPKVSPDVDYIELFMVQIQTAQNKHLASNGEGFLGEDKAKFPDIQHKMESSNLNTSSARKKRAVRKSLQQRHQYVNDKLLSLVRMIWQFNRIFFDSLGVPGEHSEYIIEQTYFLDWLLKRLLAPQTGLPLITLTKNDLKSCASQLGNLEIYMLRFIDFRVTPRSRAVSEKGNPEVMNISHELIATIRVACRLMGYYYKETNLRKWNLFFPNDINFLGNLARSKDKIDRDKYEKFKLLRRVGFYPIEVLPWENPMSEYDIAATHHAIKQLKFYHLCDFWSKGFE